MDILKIRKYRRCDVDVGEPADKALGMAMSVGWVRVIDNRVGFKGPYLY